MCIAIRHGKRCAYFLNRHARIPIIYQQTIKPMPWGRRAFEQGQLPIGGWCRLDWLQQGHFDQFFPKKIKIPVQQFYIADCLARRHWFILADGEYISGIIMNNGHEYRVYMSMFITEGLENFYWHWPLIERTPQPLPTNS